MSSFFPSFSVSTPFSLGRGRGRGRGCWLVWAPSRRFHVRWPLHRATEKKVETTGETLWPTKLERLPLTPFFVCRSLSFFFFVVVFSQLVVVAFYRRCSSLFHFFFCRLVFACSFFHDRVLASSSIEMQTWFRVKRKGELATIDGLNGGRRQARDKGSVILAGLSIPRPRPSLLLMAHERGKKEPRRLFE